MNWAKAWKVETKRQSVWYKKLEKTCEEQEAFNAEIYSKHLLCRDYFMHLSGKYGEEPNYNRMLELREQIYKSMGIEVKE